MSDNESMQHYVIPVGNTTVHLYCSVDELPRSLSKATDESERLLKESGGNWKSISGPYRYRIDGPHDATTGHRHIHVYKKNNELFSLNWDGTGHDNSRGTEIPKKVYDHLSSKHPDLPLPDNRIIESINLGRRLIKFSEYFMLRRNDPDAMPSLDAAVALLEEFVNHPNGDTNDA